MFSAAATRNCWRLTMAQVDGLIVAEETCVAILAFVRASARAGPAKPDGKVAEVPDFIIWRDGGAPRTAAIGDQASRPCTTSFGAKGTIF